MRVCLCVFTRADCGFSDLSAPAGGAAVRRQEEAGGAEQWRGAEQQPVGSAGLQQDSGQPLCSALYSTLTPETQASLQRSCIAR